MTGPWHDFCATLLRDHVIGSQLVSGPLNDAALERRLTAARRACLMNGGGPLELLAHLAIQGFLNEYVWAQDEAETARAEACWTAVAGGLRRPEAVLLAGCYRPLADLPDARALLQGDWPAPVRGVLNELVAGPLRDRDAAPGIPAITPLRTGVSEAVRAQYERHPYPRWAARPLTRGGDGARRLIEMFPDAAAAPLPERPDILIAGCGTGRHALSAAQIHPDGQVLAVDLSRASLAFATRRTQELGVRNIEFAQADLLELGRVGRTFDIVESVGVLHHLADPFEGARVLSGLLRPGGAVKLGVYSAAARQVLAPAKALARTFGVERIRDLRTAILNAPQDDPVRAVAGLSDFNAASSCRDLLLHVNEHEMAFGDIRRLLDILDVRFLGFTVGEPAKAAYREMFPDDPAMTNLDHWEAFEQLRPRTFIGMYQFWGQRA